MVIFKRIKFFDLIFSKSHRYDDWTNALLYQKYSINGLHVKRIALYFYVSSVYIYYAHIVEKFLGAAFI